MKGGVHRVAKSSPILPQVHAPEDSAFHANSFQYSSSIFSGHFELCVELLVLAPP